MRLLSAAIGFGVAMLLAAPAFADQAEKDAQKECASYGLSAGAQDYKDCVSKMADANRAGGGASDNAAMSGDARKMRADMNAQSARQRADMDADMKKRRAAMQKQMQDAEHPADGKKSNCAVTKNGTNTSVQCP